ncbi:MAG: hypothetical protein EZS28_012603 [Streblomastix strix]|uniref:Uncharacterized protein n=1 Tax=Streblomastix strix TaxID=222440 RepID=A0A5J4WA97_9EUKA|nr:MAG: hypothetical protein EZS28_012603 [Streblomastix strix]
MHYKKDNQQNQNDNLVSINLVTQIASFPNFDSKAARPLNQDPNQPVKGLQATTGGQGGLGPHLVGGLGAMDSQARVWSSCPRQGLLVRSSTRWGKEGSTTFQDNYKGTTY